MCHAHLHNTYLHVDIEGSRAGAIMAGQRIQEIDAVRVVLLHRGHVEVCHLARCSSRGVDQHEGTYHQHKRRNKSGYNVTCANDITTASRDNVTRLFLNILSSSVTGRSFYCYSITLLLLLFDCLSFIIRPDLILMFVVIISQHKMAQTNGQRWRWLIQ